MKLFRFCSTGVLSLLMAGVLIAQTPPQQPPPTSQQPPRATQPATPAPDAAEMTIVGCLAQSKDDADDFVLTVSPAGAAQAAGAPTSTDATRATNPTTGAAGAARTGASATPATYKIVGIDDAQLKPHLNHQVELKGRLNASAAPGAAAPAAGGGMQPKEFRASEVKMLNATCPPAK